jgi:hypothetical protein
MRSIANLAWWYNQTFLAGQAKLPGILVPAKLQARFKPLKYSNQRAKTLLNWTPQYSMEEAFSRSCSDQDLVAVPLTDLTRTDSKEAPGIPVQAGR